MFAIAASYKDATRKTYKKIKKEGTATMMEWINVTDSFTEKQRHYSNTYLEIDEVFDNVVEVSLFSSQQGPYEIFISYGILYGIVYVEEDKAYAKREEIKKELYSKGAIYAAMSGSGSSVFGLFSPEEKITKMDFEAAFCFQTELK